MSPNPTQAYITCEFESVDMADLSIGRLMKETGGIRRVTMHGRQISCPHPVPIMLAVNPSADISPAYLMTPQNLLTAMNEPSQVVEPEQIKSVTAKIQCNRKNARSVAARLTGLGATHIHIH